MVEEPIEETEVVVATPEPMPEVRVEPGSLDIVRAPYNRSQTEPDLHAIRIGASISEWQWLEPEQIQMMRQQVLVLIENNGK